MDLRLLLLSGAVATALYVATVILGGILDPSYSHISRAVSELIATGAPNKRLLDGLFSLYNVLVIAFGVGLFLTVRPTGGATSGIIGAAALIAIGALGLALTLFFAMDPRGAAATPRGRIHLILAGLISLGTMLAILFTGLWLRLQPGLEGFAVYSFISLIITFASGALAAVTAAQGSPYLGLFERVTIGVFLQWQLVIALRLYAYAGAPAL